MSDRTILDRYVGRPPLAPTPDSVTLAADGEEEVLGCFGLLRGMRERAVCLELRRRTGEVVAIPYGYVSRLEFTPAGGIRVCCGADAVLIRGRNLNREVGPRLTLFSGLARHAVPWVCEADRAASLASGGEAVVVEKIEW
jgi:hypothetical protein